MFQECQLRCLIIHAHLNGDKIIHAVQSELKHPCMVIALFTACAALVYHTPHVSVVSIVNSYMTQHLHTT